MNKKSVSSLPGYWCEYTVCTPADEFGMRTVATYEAYSADMAIRWVLDSLSNLETKFTSQDSRAVTDWLFYGYCESVKELRLNQELSLFISQGPTRIEWDIRKVKFLPLIRCHEDFPPCHVEVSPTDVRTISG